MRIFLSLSRQQKKSIIGFVARTRLRENPEFLQKKFKAIFANKEVHKSKSLRMFLSQEKVEKQWLRFFQPTIGLA